MSASIAVILARSGTRDGLPWPVYLIGILVAVAFLIDRYSQFFAQRLSGFRGRNWPTVSAVIDLVSVQKRVESTGKGDIATYVAMLTYVYHSPDLQTGDYDQSFYNEEEARTWADSYKGSKIKIHVDPRDPSRSVLRKEDL